MPETTPSPANRTDLELKKFVALGNKLGVVVFARINPLSLGAPIKSDVGTSAVLVFDASAYPETRAVIVTNAGTDTIYLYTANTVAANKFIKRLAAGESWEVPLGGSADTTNDLYAIRATAPSDDDVIVTPLTEM